MKNMPLSTVDSHPAWGDAHTLGNAPADVRLCFLGRLWDVIIRRDVQWEVPCPHLWGRAGSRSGQREKLSHNAGLTAARTDCTPWGAQELSGLSELACFGPSGQAFVPPFTPFTVPSWEGQGPGGSQQLRPLCRDNWRVFADHTLCSSAAVPFWNGDWTVPVSIRPQWRWLTRRILCPLPAYGHWGKGHRIAPHYLKLFPLEGGWGDWAYLVEEPTV